MKKIFFFTAFVFTFFAFGCNTIGDGYMALSANVKLRVVTGTKEIHVLHAQPHYTITYHSMKQLDGCAEFYKNGNMILKTCSDCQGCTQEVTYFEEGE